VRHADANAYGYIYTDGHANSHSYSHGHVHTNSYSYGHLHTNSHRYGYGYGDCNLDAYTYQHAETYADGQAAAFASSADRALSATLKGGNSRETPREFPACGGSAKASGPPSVIRIGASMY
jgi:hypothetical protein